MQHGAYAGGESAGNAPGLIAVVAQPVHTAPYALAPVRVLVGARRALDAPSFLSTRRGARWAREGSAGGTGRRGHKPTNASPHSKLVAAKTRAGCGQQMSQVASEAGQTAAAVCGQAECLVPTDSTDLAMQVETRTERATGSCCLPNVAPSLQGRICTAWDPSMATDESGAKFSLLPILRHRRPWHATHLKESADNDVQRAGARRRAPIKRFRHLVCMPRGQPGGIPNHRCKPDQVSSG